MKLRLTRTAAVLAVVCVAGGAAGAGCTAGQAATPPPRQAGSPAPMTASAALASRTKHDGCRIGISWDNYNNAEQLEIPAMNAVFNRAQGQDWRESDAKSSVEYQEADIDTFVKEGMDVIILRRQGDGSGSAAVKRAIAAGIPVIAEDRPLENPGILWMTVDKVEIGRMEARSMLAARPNGNYVISNGEEGSDAERLRQGIHEILDPAVKSGAITIVAETYTPEWDPSVGYNKMLAILAKNSRIDVVIAANDGIAAGAIQALQEQGLADKVAVSGAFTDVYGLKRVFAGTQIVDVWENRGRMGTAAAEAAVALCANSDIASIAGAKQITSPGGNQMWQVVFQPKAITKDNLDLVLTAEPYTKQAFCADETLAGTPLCK